MDLEKINQEYVKLKNELEIARDAIKNLSTKATDLADDKIIWQAKTIEAKRNNDESAEKTAKDEIEKIDNELKKIKKEAIEKRDVIIELKGKIDERVNTIKENPEMKEHLNEVLTKKYNRKLSSIEKEREELIEKKSRMMNIKKLVEEHPALGNNLKGIMSAKKEVKDLETELENLKVEVPSGVPTYSNPTRAYEIMNTLLPQAKDRENNNKTALMTYITNNKINIKEEDIDEIVNKDYILNDSGEIQFEETLNKNLNIKGIDKQIKGYDKSIKDFQIAAVNRTIPTQPSNARTGFTTPVASSTSTPEPEPEVKPKWYQFIQRFKNWNKKRKQPAIPEPVIDEPEGTTPPTAGDEEKQDFKNSLKYEIVQDITKQMEKEGLKDAKVTRKELENR